MATQRNKLVVTGATGFIGSHLARRLAQENGALVVGTGRNLSRAASDLDQSVALVEADLLDFARMRDIVRGADVVFHVAAWLGSRHGEPDMAWPVNVWATLELVRAAASGGARRLVLVSSIAAYGPRTDAIVCESDSLDVTQRSLYGRTKAEGEMRAMELAHRLGLELTIVRPGMVYGPGSIGWSVRMVRLLQLGVPVIWGNGDGYAYPVYVGNLVNGIILAARQPQAAGEAFQFVDTPMTWRDWFGHFGRMCGRPPRRAPLWLARRLFQVAEWLPLGLSVDRDLIVYYTSRSVLPLTKASRLLGYEPGVTIREGMKRTETWLREAGYLSRDAGGTR